MFTQEEITAIAVTLKLASVTTLILLGIGTPLAVWLAGTRSVLKGPIAAVIAMPLVLPPTVLGFYLLLALGPNSWIGQATQWLGIGSLPFSFWGLVVGSVIYSLPFVVQPIYNSVQAIGERPFEVAATLGAGPLDRFFSIALPLAKPGILTAAILGFAHTVGEFGVVLMIGGNIEGETRVLSVLIYDQVEALEYGRAHVLSLTLVIFAFLVLLGVYSLQGRLGTVARRHKEVLNGTD